MQSSNRIEFANTLRGIAALLVVFGHQLGFFWQGREIVAWQSHMPILPFDQFPTPAYASWAESFYRIRWGIFGVAIFFLVSGFVIPFSFQKTSGRAFLVGRVFRLFPTYAVATAITIAVVWLGTNYFSLAWPYTFDQIAANSFPGLRDLAWEAPIDGVVWTLEVEVKFYLLCAVMAPLLKRYSKLVFLAPFLIFVPALLFWRHAAGLQSPSGYAYTLPFALANSGQYVIYMFIGIAFHYVYMKRMLWREFALVAAVQLIMMGVLWINARDILTSHTWPNFAVPVVVFGLCMRLKSLSQGNRVVRFLADISYPLYICHCVAGYVALRVLLNLGSPSWLANGVVLCLVIFNAWFLHKAIEAPSHDIGRHIMSRLSKPQLSHQSTKYEPLMRNTDVFVKSVSESDVPEPAAKRVAATCVLPPAKQG